MKILLHWLLGYSVIKLSFSNLKEILNFSNAEKIQILALKIENEFATIRIYTKDVTKFVSELERLNIGFRIEKLRGLPHICEKYRHRVGLNLGILIFIAVMYISPLFIWEINLTGLERLSREDVIELLKESGVEVGSFSPLIDRSEVYRNILLSSKEISWVSVNIQGSSANVEIVEREYEVASQTLADGANIIALKDGQIVEANIIKGRRNVKNGEIVKQGDLLVSGVYDSVEMGTRFVYSSAKVYARVIDEFSAEVSLKNSQKTYDEEKVIEMSLKMFGKSINIFKNYSKLEGKYDTIIREDSVPLLGLERLPVVVEKISALPYDYIPVTFTEAYAVEIAKREVRDRIASAGYSEIISTEENYFVENETLYFHCNVEAVQNIALVSEFSIN